jgi:hypothetical protein
VATAESTDLTYTSRERALVIEGKEQAGRLSSPGSLR